ncbi:MAG TPA: sugar kinase [Actinomycetales bacterium]|nr:sugar kinase [Actinomycetales bacterium]
MTQRLDVLTIGESMVAFHGDGAWSEGSRASARVAGAESNVAIGLARLGHTVSWCGRLGTDPFGDLVLRQLRAEAVGVEHVVRDPGGPTGLMFVEHRTADVVRVEYRRDRSAGSRLRLGDVEAALGAGPRLLHLTGITPALSPTARCAVLHAAEVARAGQVLVSLDVNFRSRLWSREEARDALRDLVRHVDVVVASDDELDLVADGDDAAAARELLGSGVGHVAVKRGPDGATLWTGDERYDVPALRVTAVDPFGAGDAFTAGLLSGLLDGLGGAESLRRGARLGAFAVSTLGDWHGLPRRDELHLLDGLRPGTLLR